MSWSLSSLLCTINVSIVVTTCTIAIISVIHCLMSLYQSIIILLHSNQVSSWLVSLLSNLLTFSFKVSCFTRFDHSKKSRCSICIETYMKKKNNFYITWFEQTRTWPPKSPGLCMYQDIVQILRQNSKSRSPATFLCSNSENIRLQGFPWKDGKTSLLPWKVLTPKNGERLERWKWEPTMIMEKATMHEDERCISYWKWAFSTVIFVSQGCTT